ncbi:hypothetical protein CPC08DRAFT_767484 [Agrocybe pediades]|nr:hypothetical protein CPC08DRAFT_767484 [Agrocybe pediades]
MHGRNGRATDNFPCPRMLTPEDDFNKDSSPQDLGDVQQSYPHTKPSRRPHAVLRPTTRLISTSPSYVPDISGGEDAEAEDGASQTRRTQQQIEGKKKRKHVDEDEYSYSSPPHPRPPRKRRLHDSEGGASTKQGAKGKDKRSSVATGGTSTPIRRRNAASLLEMSNLRGSCGILLSPPWKTRTSIWSRTLGVYAPSAIST